MQLGCCAASCWVLGPWGPTSHSGSERYIRGLLAHPLIDPANQENGETTRRTLGLGLSLSVVERKALNAWMSKVLFSLHSSLCPTHLERCRDASEDG